MMTDNTNLFLCTYVFLCNDTVTAVVTTRVTVPESSGLVEPVSRNKEIKIWSP